MTIIEALINREGITYEEALEIKNEIAQEIQERIDEDPEEILAEYGLEPDYLLEVLNY